MAESDYQRVAGVETEFGCLVTDDTIGRPEIAVEMIKDHIFEEMKLGVIDLIARDEIFEPARSGGFLLNGGRIYIDAVGSHLEYATAECLSLDDLVKNDRAGQRIIVRAIRELGLEGIVKVFNNSVDHFGGHTFGCHENYSVLMEEDFFSHRAPLLIPFLVTRQIYAGVGRVGGHRLTEFNKRLSHEEIMENPIDYIWVSQIYGVDSDPDVKFQLCQRADHIIKTTASRVRFNRALINPKWESFYAHDNLARLHLLFGESNQMDFAYKLKVGATRLALRLIEENRVPSSVLLSSPLMAMRHISRDETYRWEVSDLDGNPTTALEVQQIFLHLAESYRGSDADTDWTLDAWRDTLDQLAKDPMVLADRLDWVAKKKLITEFVEENQLEWSDDILHSVDMEYHCIDPSLSLFHALVDMGQVYGQVGELDVVEAMTDAPVNTRAAARSQLVAEILKNYPRGPYSVDWSGVSLGRFDYRELADPLDPDVPPSIH